MDFHASPDGEGKVFRFDLLQCLSCPTRDGCTTGDFRSVKVKEAIPDLQDALTYGKTADLAPYFASKVRRRERRSFSGDRA